MHSTKYPAFSNRTSGSALLAVIIFTMMSFIILGTILPAALSNYKGNIRNTQRVASFFLAESGADEALWALNNFKETSEWVTDGWEFSKDGKHLTKTLDLADEDSGFQLGNKYSGKMRIIVEDPGNSSAIGIYSEGKVTNVDSNHSISQYVVLRTSVQSPFVGLIAKDNMSFNGRPRFDSYNSSKFPYTYLLGLNSNDNVTVGSVSSASGSVDIGNASIYGNIVSGSADPVSSGAVKAGSNSYLTGDVLGNYSQSFPDVTPPDTSSGSWQTSF